MATEEAHEKQGNDPMKSKIRLGNSDSEFRLIERSETKSSSRGTHCIYTIDELNDRIGNLSGSFNRFITDDHNLIGYENDAVPNTPNPINYYEGNEKDRKAVKQFSGIYSTHSVLSRENTTKTNGANLTGYKKKLKNAINTHESDRNISKKPMLVELHSFPGYDDDELTPLPSPLDALFILDVVIRAQLDMKNKPRFRSSFIEFFKSQQSQAILQDSFWWYFCYKYHSLSGSQEKLFDRISKNYTNLLITWTGAKYQDKLFKNYANLISQAIYSTFCHAFPTSYRQFNGEFRDDILALITLWLMGTKPAPRTWDKWNFDYLEPTGLRKGEKIQEDAVKAKTLELDFKSFDDSIKTPRRGSRRAGSISNRHNSKEPSVSFDNSSNNNNNNNTKTTLKQAKQCVSNGNITNQSSSSTLVTIDESKESVGHISNGQNGVKKSDMENIMKQISSVLGIAESKQKKQSCAVGAGPKFTRVVFDVYGRSPMVEHFLQTHNLLKDAGTSILVQRTEIVSLPPISAETYEDVINSSRTSSKVSQKKYCSAYNINNKERQKHIQKQKLESIKFSRCSGKLLSKPHEVKEISDLLKLPDTKDEPEDADIRSARLRILIDHALEDNDEH